MRQKKTYLKLHRIGVVSEPGKHGHGMMKDVASTLYTLIEPTRSMFLLVNGNGKCLSSTVIHGINQGDIEFIWMLG